MSIFDKVQLSKGRVAVTLTEIENKVGGIYLPEDRKKIFSIGTVVGIGPELKDRPCHLRINDEVVFQIPAYIAANYGYHVDGQDFMILNQGDILGRLTNGTRISFDTFEPMGEWLLCEVKREIMRGGLYLPEDVQAGVSSLPPRHILSKKGPYCDLEADIGTELLIDRARATPIQFDLQAGSGSRGEFVYLSPGSVYGMVK